MIINNDGGNMRFSKESGTGRIYVFFKRKGAPGMAKGAKERTDRLWEFRRFSAGEGLDLCGAHCCRPSKKTLE